MELVLLLEKDHLEKKRKQLCGEKVSALHYEVTSRLPKRAQDKIITYMQRLYEQDKRIVEIGIRVPFKQNGLMQRKTPQHSNECGCILKGAGFGGGCGLLSGTNGMCAYALLDGCMWLWCDVITPAKILTNIMCWGLPTCTCVGCLAGACCVATGCSKRIDRYFD